MDANYTPIAKKIQDVNFLLKGREERQPTKKRMIVLKGTISKKHFVKDSFFKNDVPQKEFLEDLGLFHKNYLPIQFVECIWFKHLVFHFCPKLNFPSRR
jgi:hypothetical protein